VARVGACRGQGWAWSRQCGDCGCDGVGLPHHLGWGCHITRGGVATSRCLWTTVDEAPVWPGCRRPEPLRAAAEAGPGAGGAETAGATWRSAAGAWPGRHVNLVPPLGQGLSSGGLAMAGLDFFLGRGTARRG